MPFAQIHMIEGRTEEQKKAVIEKVSQALVEATGAPIANVRVLITEVPKENWGIAGVSAKELGRKAPHLGARAPPKKKALATMVSIAASACSATV